MKTIIIYGSLEANLIFRR